MEKVKVLEGENMELQRAMQVGAVSNELRAWLLPPVCYKCMCYCVLGNDEITMSRTGPIAE